MRPEKLLQIIKSSENEESITHTILSKITEDKSLLGPFFEHNRTLFHILVLHKLNTVIQNLLKNKKLNRELINSLKSRDEFGNNVFHLCIIGEAENPKLLDYLTKVHPEGAYEKNKQNRTPAEEAFHLNKLWAQEWASPMLAAEILNIIDEIKDQGIIADLLEKKIVANISYLKPIFEHNRTLFHLLATHHLTGVIKTLLESKNKKLINPLRESLIARDKQNSNVFHLCVLAQRENPELLQLLMQIHPEGLYETHQTYNTIDNERIPIKRTPAEEAFHNNKAWALKLISKQVSPSVARPKSPLKLVYSQLREKGLPLKIKFTHHFENDCKTLAEELKAILQGHIDKNEFTGPIFLFGLNFFHILAKNNLVIVLEELLKVSILKEFASKRDNHGNGILHHCIKAEGDCTPMLHLLIEKLPNLINTPNDNGNTPLHQAVLCGNYRAVEILLKNSADMKQVNGQEKSPLDIANERFDTRSQRIKIMFENPDALEKVNQFYQEFPLLTAKHAEKESEITKISSIKKTRSLSDATQSTLPLEDDRKIRYLKFLPPTAYPLELIAFAYYCEHTCLDIPEKIIQKRNKNKKTYKVLIDTLNQLAPAAKSMFVDHYAQHETLLAQFNRFMMKSRLKTNPDPVSPPEVLVIAPFTHEDSELKRNLTAYLFDETVLTRFDSTDLMHYTLGLLSRFPANDLIRTINELYPHLNLNQKLVANFIIIHMVHFNSSMNFVDVTISRELDKLLLLNRGLDQTGKKLNDYFNRLLKLNAGFNSNPLIFNYKLLDRWLGAFQNIQKQDSFDHLVNTALSSKNEERKWYMELIAKELRIWTINFFQRIRPMEFSSQEIFNHFVKAKENLGQYFSNLVLDQPDGKVTETLGFIVDLISLTLSFDRHTTIDLNLLRLLSLFFSTSAISRLKPYLEQLPMETQKLIDEYCKLISPLKNNHYLTLLKSLFPSKIVLDPALINTEITFLKDGNKDNVQSLLSMLGQTIIKTMPSQFNAHYEPAHFATDLPQILNSPASEHANEHLFTKSLRLVPVADSVEYLDLDEYKAQSGLLIDKISSDYLSNKTIPTLKYDGKYASRSAVIGILIEWYSSLKSEEHAWDFNKFTHLVHLFVEVNNKYYYPAKSNTYLNPIYFKVLLNPAYRKMLEKIQFSATHREPDKGASQPTQSLPKILSRVVKKPRAQERESLRHKLPSRESAKNAKSPHAFFSEPLSRKKVSEPKTRPRSTIDPIAQ